MKNPFCKWGFFFAIKPLLKEDLEDIKVKADRHSRFLLVWFITILSFIYRGESRLMKVFELAQRIVSNCRVDHKLKTN